MDISVFLAKFLGFYFIILAVGMFINVGRFQSFELETANHHYFIMLTGILSVIFGLIIVMVNNIWSGWPIIITIIGWLSILKGMARLYFPSQCAKLIRRVVESKNYYFIVPAITLVIGLFLLHCGFFG